MTTVVHGPAATWATAHRTLLFLLALTVAVVAAVVVTLVVQLAGDEATTGPAAPVPNVEEACDLPMTGTFC
jgi:hypothetical protein